MKATLLSFVFAAAGAVIAAIDGPFLGGVAAVIGSVTTLVLGILTLQQKRRDASGDAWEALARELLAEKEAAAHDGT